MKQLFMTLIGILCIATSCKYELKEREEPITVPKKLEHRLSKTDSLKKKFKPDTTIAGICLLNSKKVDSILGNNVMERLVHKGLPNTSVVSRDSEQLLTIYFHPGNEAKEFSEFHVAHAVGTEEKELAMKENEFKTESGIRLGMTAGQLKAIKGEPHRITNMDNATVLHYRVDDFKTSKFLKRYNMPVYYADYEFSNGHLRAFKFGFEYP
ncbi:hypothetical protein GUA46_03710 [Muricauda sp. HICW]|uniref:Uncharacterized protein n=1 Tax=Flagellimonas chongwuensis TaxID=2697365 RepID=A0A850NJN5_9FLAO|nr:hypothetical protein [Allomuricauda chongwuensis]NVN17437.1 hypothetical protein [Allomuricauda chongwuensis]